MEEEISVALDLDNVLRPFTGHIARFYAQNYYELNGMSGHVLRPLPLSLSDFGRIGYRYVWGGTEEIAVKIVRMFYKSELFKEIPPIPGAVEFVQGLVNDGVGVSVITSCYAGEEETIGWLRNWFGGLINPEYVCFTNEFLGENKQVSLEDERLVKLEICKERGISVLIDDVFWYLRGCARFGVTGLLFNWQGKYRWITKGQECEDVYIVESYDKARRRIDALRYSGQEIGY